MANKKDLFKKLIQMDTRFYDDKYITILENNIVSTYKKDNFELLHTFKLEFTPNTLEIGHNGEFVIMTLNNHIATLDMESSDITEWQTDGETFGWLDTDMIFSISDGKLIVYDYDGLNRRILSSNVSGHFPITITNDKWLYYFSDDSLVRETIAN